jgi:glycosyltransferase involved in cell wall biosynthesis
MTRKNGTNDSPSNTPTLSVIILALNEERRLRACIESVRWADEIIVGDTGSTDGTVELAESLGAKVIAFEFNGFGDAKQHLLEQATGDWIFSLDADERVTPRLRDALQAILSHKQGNAGYRVRRQAWFLGKPIRYGGWGMDFPVRLVRHGQGRFTSDVVHEKLMIDGTVGTLPGLLEHHTDPTYPHYLQKIDRYSTLGALKAIEAGKRSGVAAALARAVFKFVKMYIVKQGWRDGLRGALLAGSSAYSNYLRYIKAEMIRRGDRDVFTASRLQEVFRENHEPDA